jgi:hypothetical protein
MGKVRTFLRYLELSSHWRRQKGMLLHGVEKFDSDSGWTLSTFDWAVCPMAEDGVWQNQATRFVRSVPR